jgi:hypothetical protein
MSAEPLVTVFRDKTGAAINAVRPMTLTEVARVIRTAPPVPKREDAALLKLAKFGDNLTRKGSIRHDDNVIEISGIEGDYDAGRMSISEAAERIRNAGIEALLYTTGSHTQEKPRWRVIAPFGRNYHGTPGELHATRAHWVNVLDAVLGGVLASESLTLSQTYFFGRIKDRPDPEIIIIDGKPIDDAPGLPAPIARKVSTERNAPAQTAGDDFRADEGVALIAAGHHIFKPTLKLCGRLVAKGLPAPEAAELVRSVLLRHRDAWETDIARWQEAYDKAPRMAEDAVRKGFSPPPPPEPPPTPEDDPGFADADDRRADREADPVIDEPPPGPEAATTTSAGAAGSKTSIVLRHICEIVAERREPRWLSPSLHKIVERGVLGVLAGQRGTFKSFVALDWMLRAALDGETVIILSGEGAGLDRRVDAWMRTHAPDRDLAELRMLALERPLNLCGTTELAALAEAIEAIGSPPPSAILIDTFSKFAAGLDENDNAEVAAYLSGLSRALRERFDCTVLLVAHAGHGDARRPRGASALMANPDCEYIIERSPPAMVCTVSRERFKDYPSLPPLAYQAEVIDLGRVDAHGEQVTSLVMRTSDAPPVMRAPRAGANQARALTALREWMRTHPEDRYITFMDMQGLLKAQGIDRRRRPDALNYMVHAGVITTSIGGFTLNRDMA